MHLKKTKKTPRMFRMIALMLSLVLVFFTMTGLRKKGQTCPMPRLTAPLKLWRQNWR